jgi:4-hydroxy-tetrahydrodipicolinate reductase
MRQHLNVRKVGNMEKVKVVLYGVGAMGSRIAKFLLEKEGVEIVGAIDIAEDKVGKDLGEILGLDSQLGILASNDPEAVFSRVKADIMVHATTSFLKQVYPQIAKAVEHGVNVVSTCEELAYPHATEPKLAKKLDELAKEHEVTVLGTGINPGFIMDTLAITLTGVYQKVEKIKVTRIVNAATRRVPFQKKIGAGLSIKEFRDKIERKIITGHAGLEQSISMIASALGWELDEIEVDPIEPVVAKNPVESEAIRVEPSQVAGLRQHSRGMMSGKEVITLDLQAYIGAEEEYDSISIEGTPSFHMKIAPCIHGDVGTVAMIVNSIPKVLRAPPGLVTMKDLPIPSAVLKDMRKYIHQ